MKNSLLLTLLTVAVASVALGQTFHQVKPGLYETTATMELIGMPYAPPPTTFQHCITPEDAADAKRTFAKSAKDCVLKDQKSDGNKLTFAMECTTPRGVSTGTGAVEWAADAFQSTFNMTMDIPQRGRVQIIRKSQTRRIGECTK